MIVDGRLKPGVTVEQAQQEMKPGRCRVAGLCGAILTTWWAVGPSPTRAQTTVGSADVPLPIENAAGLRLLVATDHTSPVLRVILPGRPTSNRSIESSSPNTSPSSNKARALPNSSICSVPDSVVTDRYGGAPVHLSNTSVTSETGSICSREPRWRTTACASAMKCETSLGWHTT